MLILASQSPRRRELLELAGLTFECIPARGEESVPEGMSAEEEPEFLALQKASEVFAAHPEDVVIGSDTLVVLDGKPLGKPHTEQEAFEMLAHLSGREHYVYTGVAILSPGERVSFTTVTKVELYALTEEEIWDYIRTGEPMDKAGAYGIQGRGALLIRRIHGDYYTVMGLPIAEVVRHLPKRLRTESGNGGVS